MLRLFPKKYIISPSCRYMTTTTSTLSCCSSRSRPTATTLLYLRQFTTSSVNESTSSLSSSNDANQKQKKKQLRKRLDVAIVGAPNAGKSQLLNVLTQSPISAVSRKRHTTRSDVLGARTLFDNTNNNNNNNNNNIPTQIVFKDTPGFLKIENAKAERLDRDLIVTAAAELQTVDYSLLVVDSARKLNETYTEALELLMKGALDSKGRIEEEELDLEDDLDDDDDDDDSEDGDEEQDDDEEQQAELRPKFAIVLNKVDLVKDKTSLLDLAMDIGALADQALSNKYAGGKKEVDFDIMMKVAPIVFYVSALQEDGVDDILDHLAGLATPCVSWPVEAGQSTTLTPLEQVEELIREKLYRCLHREVPHSVRQENRLFRQVPQGMIIHQDLVVFSKSHKKLVMGGGGGKTLQRIEDGAVRDLKKLFGCEVALRLHVRIGKTKNVRSADEYE